MGLASVVLVGTAGVAAANTIHFEAESIRDRTRGTITSPMMIKDDPAASGGSYMAVAAGNESPSNAPASSTEGVAKYTFSISDTGTYRIWARVSVANDGDDSFWVRMGTSGSWIKWNGIQVGTAYHWVLVKPEGGSPSTFALTADVDNELQIAYREDGTRLDALFITNDTAFAPNAPLTGAPAPPVMQPAVNGGAAKVSWSAVPGATSYTLEHRSGGCSFNEETQCCEPDDPFVPVATGLTVHKFTTSTPGLYRVTAVAPTGTSFHPVPQSPECFPFDPSESNASTDPFHFPTQSFVPSVTSPMKLFADGLGAPAGTESNSSPPTHGRARLDFELAASVTMRMWAQILAPNKDQDSFWVRWDDGSWIKWNNLITGCNTLFDSDKSGAPIVRQVLGAGSHRIEWAYREGGARLTDAIVLTTDVPNQPAQCSD
jgi:hypothetical protein